MNLAAIGPGGSLKTKDISYFSVHLPQQPLSPLLLLLLHRVFDLPRITISSECIHR